MNKLSTFKDDNQPAEYDAILGGTVSIPGDTAILGGIAGVKQRLTSPIVSVRVEALSVAISYAQQGLEAIIQALEDESLEVRQAAYFILKDRSDCSITVAEFETKILTSPQSLFEDLAVFSKYLQEQRKRYSGGQEYLFRTWEELALSVNLELTKMKSDNIVVLQQSRISDCSLAKDVLGTVFNFSPFKGRNIYKASYAYSKFYLKGEIFFLGRAWWYADYRWAGTRIGIAQNYLPTDAPIASGMRYRVFEMKSTNPNVDWIRIGTYRSQQSAEAKVKELKVANPKKMFGFIDEPILPTRKVELPPGHTCKSYRTGKMENYQEIPIGSENAIHPDI
jgi:hypothetical protein